jgi:acetyl-CoA acetyltransferase
MGLGPVPAVRKLLSRLEVDLADVDLIELNEAFAAQALGVCRELELDSEDDRLNVNGGAIALGHPLGCSGARLITTLVHELGRRPDARLGLATMCIGVGQGIAALIEKAEA